MKPVSIIGGGLAGLALGIGLRRREIPATLHEAGRYPRHRVCGEFISGRGLETLARLGLRPQLGQAGAVEAASAAFFTESRCTGPRPLPSPAICISRFDLDGALAGEFRRMGGELREESRWQQGFGEGIVRATGRRLQPAAGRDGWFGLKIHARNVALTADLEMHISPRGYVGLCRLRGGIVNVCGLFRRRGDPNGGPRNWRDWLCGRAGSPLHQRLAPAQFHEDSFCAIAGLSLLPQRAETHGECALGDAITMIPPVTGNGMSMAFESAELAIAPLAEWSRGKISWAEARRQIAHRCDTAFARRLAWAKWLQRAMLSPALQNLLVALAARSPRFWRTAFEQTR